MVSMLDIGLMVLVWIVIIWVIGGFIQHVIAYRNYRKQYPYSRRLEVWQRVGPKRLKR